MSTVTIAIQIPPERFWPWVQKADHESGGVDVVGGHDEVFEEVVIAVATPNSSETTA